MIFEVDFYSLLKIHNALYDITINTIKKKYGNKNLIQKINFVKFMLNKTHFNKLKKPNNKF